MSTGSPAGAPAGDAAAPVDAPVRAAIVGCGDVSVVHAEALAAMAEDGLARLVAVVDTDPDRRDAAARRTGATPYDSVESLVAAGGVDVVHVTTPHDAHVDASIAALRAGVHVIQEKPVAHTRAEADRLVAVAEDPAVVERPGAAGAPRVHVGLCYQNRYNASSQALRRLLDDGALGRVTGAYASVVWTRSAGYYRARPWRASWRRAGGGLLINQALHTLDLIAWFGGGVAEVRGSASSRVFGDVSEVEDTAEAVIVHPDGTRTTFYGSLTAPRHRAVELEITGELATAAIGPGGLTVTYADDHVETWPERRVASAGRSYWGVSHELLIRDFYAHLRQDTPYWISPREGLVALDILTAIYDQSDLPGRTHP